MQEINALLLLYLLITAGLAIGCAIAKLLSWWDRKRQVRQYKTTRKP